MPERPSADRETLPRWKGKLENKRKNQHDRFHGLALEPALHLLGYMELWTEFELMRPMFRLYYQRLCFVFCFFFFLFIDLAAIVSNIISNIYGTIWVELHPPQNSHDEVLTLVSQGVALCGDRFFIKVTKLK